MQKMQSPCAAPRPTGRLPVTQWVQCVSEENLEGSVVDGRYELLSVLGEGAMGVVYRARQRVVDRPVAVKMLHKEFAEDAGFRLRFEREAQALGRLDHPGCVRVYDFGWFDEANAPYLVSELVEGTTLHEAREGWGDLDLLRISRDIATAMDHAHQQGIRHRDLKPENVLVSADTRQIKIIDFGLSRMPQEEEIRLTQVGDAHGTPAYMSPEQCRADEEVTPAVDVYALGCMIYEMFEDDLPYWAAKASTVLIMHVTQPIPPFRGTAPQAVRDLVVRMMQKQAQDRPTMAEVVTALDALIIDLEGSPPTLHSTPPVKLVVGPQQLRDTHVRNELTMDLDPFEAHGRRDRVIAAVAVVLVLVAVVFVLWPSPTPPPLPVVVATSEVVQPDPGEILAAVDVVTQPTTTAAADAGQSVDAAGPMVDAPTPTVRKPTVAKASPAADPRPETKPDADASPTTPKPRTSVKLNY